MPRRPPPKIVRATTEPQPDDGKILDEFFEKHFADARRHAEKRQRDPDPPQPEWLSKNVVRTTTGKRK